MIRSEGNIQGKINSSGNLKGKLNVGVKQVYPTLEDLEVTPTTSQQEFTHQDSYGYDTVTVNAVTSSIDNNIEATNIKQGVSILGVNGSVIELNGETKEVTPTEQQQVITPSENKNAITQVTVNRIPSEYIVPSGTLNITSNNTYDVKNYASANVNITPSLQSKSTTPTTSQQVIEADNNYDGLSSVTVNAVTSAIDNNITAENIKKDVSILGVTGTYEGSGGGGAFEVPDGMKFAYSTLTAFPEIDTSNVTNMGNMFQSCSYLITAPSINTNNVTSMTNMFNDCSNLETVGTINTSNATNMSYLFYNCGKLETIPEIDCQSCTNITYAFRNCYDLSNINIKNTNMVNSLRQTFNSCRELVTLSQLNITNVTDMNNAFTGCTKLTSISLVADTNTAKITDLNSAFKDCVTLTSIPSLITSKATYLQNMCNGCTNLVTVPQYSADVATNMSNMFANCPNLSNESLNNIMAMCIPNTKLSASNKTLKYIGLTSTQATICQNLSNYTAFTNAGWTTGY